MSNFRKRLETEVVEGLKNILNKQTNLKRLLLVLIFPVGKEENPYRINQLVEGYHIAEEYLKCTCREEAIDFKSICHCITKTKEEEYSFKKLIDKIEKYIGNSV